MPTLDDFYVVILKICWWNSRVAGYLWRQDVAATDSAHIPVPILASPCPMSNWLLKKKGHGMVITTRLERFISVFWLLIISNSPMLIRCFPKYPLKISRDVHWSLLLTWINVNPAWISNYIHYTVWDEITYPFPNFNGCTVEVWKWISNVILLHVAVNPF